MFCRTLSVLLLGLVFAVKFGSDAYGMYNPGLGRFCSRDPIGYKGGKNLYSNYFQTWGVDPNGTECTSADCIDRCKTLCALFTPRIRTCPFCSLPIIFAKISSGASWDLRSEGSPAQQCTYDSDFNLITSGPCVGTVDNSNAYPPIVGNHRPEDVTPVDWIIELQGSTLAEGCWFNKYLDVRPVNGVKPCKKTSEKHRNRWWDI